MYKRSFFFILMMLISLLAKSQLVADFCFCDDSDLPASLKSNPAGPDAIQITAETQTDGEGAYLNVNKGVNLELPRAMFGDSESLKLTFDVFRNEEHFILFELGQMEIYQWKDSFHVTYLTGNGAKVIKSGHFPSMKDQERASVEFMYVKTTGKASFLKNGKILWDTPEESCTPGEAIYLEAGTNAWVARGMDGSGAGLPVIFEFKAYTNDCPTLPLPATEDQIRCGNGRIEFEAQSSLNDVSYLWYDSADYFNPIETTSEGSFTTGEISKTKNYFVSVSKDGCTSNKASMAAIVEEQPNTDLTITPLDTTICSGANLDIQISNPQAGITYELYNPGDQLLDHTSNFQDVAILDPGDISSAAIFKVKAVSDLPGCYSYASDEPNVNVNPLSSRPVLTVSSLDNIVCTNDESMITASEAEKYFWYKDDDELAGEESQSINLTSADQSGNYKVKVKDSEESCASDFSDPLEVVIYENPEPPLVADSSRCGPGDVVLAASGSDSGNFRWYFNDELISGATADSYSTEEIEKTRSYQVAIQENGCLSELKDISAIVNELPEANAGQDRLIKKGAEAILSGSGGDEFHWEPAESLDFANIASPAASPEETTTYTLTVYTEEGCEDQDSVIVTVRDQVVYIPTSFSPNNDGLNDTWRISNIERFPECEVYIFNRWGNLVFHSEGYPVAWDGKAAGNDPVADTYVFKILLNEQEEPLMGSLTLIL